MASHRNLSVIVHGWGGRPTDGWFPWLGKELESRGYDVYIPAMPNTDAPEITPWVQTLKSTLADNPAQRILLVGHSIGCQTILRYLSEAYVPADRALFVAGWIELIGLDETEKAIAQPWLETSVAIPPLRAHLKQSTAFFSVDDPLVPLEPNRQFFEEQIGSKTVTLDGYNHFDEDAGVRAIPELLPYI